MTDNVNSKKHACELDDDPSHFVTPPTANCFRKLLDRLLGLAQASSWHHGSARFLRSRQRLRLERARQARECRLAWHPYSALKYAFDCVHLLVAAAAYLYMPMQVFHPDADPYDRFILAADALALLNVGSRFVTGYVEGERRGVVLRPRRIAAHYLRGGFAAELLAALPLQLLARVGPCDASRALLAPKLLRLPALRAQWRNVAGQLRLRHAHRALLAILLRLLLYFHWTTAAHYHAPSFCRCLYEPAALSRWLRRTAHGGDFSVFQRYTVNVFQVSGLGLGAAFYSAAAPRPLADPLLTSAATVGGLLFLAHAFGSLVSVGVSGRYESYVFAGRRRELRRLERALRLPRPLRRRVALAVQHHFNGRYFNEAAVAATLNEQLRRDVSLLGCKRLLLNVPLCRGLPTALLHALVFSLRRRLYMPAETIVKCGEEGSSMHLIYSGTVAVMTDAGKEVAHLRDGSYFGENSLIQANAVRTATIIALEITEIYNLLKSDFIDCLQPYPHLKRRLLLGKDTRVDQPTVQRSY